MTEDMFAQKGWICPKCGRVLAPLTMYCLWCCSDMKESITTTRTSIISKDEPQMGDAKPIPLSNRVTHIKDEPQTETKTETQNSNSTFEKRTMRDCYNCKRYETEGECIECHYEPKDEPQTEPLQTCSVNGRPYSECHTCGNFRCMADVPQTERSE